MFKTILATLASAKVAVYAAAAAMAGPPGPPRRPRRRIPARRIPAVPTYSVPQERRAPQRGFDILINNAKQKRADVDRYSRKERNAWPTR